MKKVKVFEDFLSESLNESNIKVGDTVSRKFMGEDPTQTWKVISISGGKAKLKDTKTGEENGMYLSDLIKESIDEAVKTKMNNLDWGKSTAERNDNLDKYNSLKTDKEKEAFLSKLKNESEEISEGVVSIKGGRIIARKVIDKLVEMDVIPEKKNTDSLVESIAKVITDAKMESIDVVEGDSELNEAVKVEVSLRHARHANELFDDMFKDYGKKLSSDVFSFKDGSGARDFIRMMIKNLQIPAGEITADEKYFS